MLFAFYAVALRKRAWNVARSFFNSERLRPAVLNVRPVNVIFVKKHVIQLPLIDHFPAAAFVEVRFSASLNSLLLSKAIRLICHENS